LDKRLYKALIDKHCGSCVNRRRGELSCIVFNEPFFLWSDGECWSKEVRVDPLEHEGVIAECFNEDTSREFRVAKPGGGSEQYDHELFPKNRMKDNRHKPKWDGFLGE